MRKGMNSYYFKITDKKEIRRLLNGNTIKEQAQLIGIGTNYLTRILNRWNGCSKLCALCVAKSFNPDYEIEDLFEIINK